MTSDDISAAVRAALADTRAIHEVKMFGGIGFMLNGNMVAAASRRGLLLRVARTGSTRCWRGRERARWKCGSRDGRLRICRSSGAGWRRR